MTQREILLVLNAIPGITGPAIKKLVSVYNYTDKIFSASQEELFEQGISTNLAINIIHFNKEMFLEAENSLLLNKGVSVITIFDESYPELLKLINYSPIVLYIKGRPECLDQPGIAMVGSRKASQYGLKIAEQFAGDFAYNNLTVISGGAYGIDTASHKGCLKANGSTIAVLGCGLNHVYPIENKQLFDEISFQGLLVSEFPMNTEPFTYNFPRRNRIISALSLGVVVVEAAKKSGSLITADFALDQNKDVFAIPGNIGNLHSEGTNQLILDGAKIVLSSQDVIEQLGIEIKTQLEQERSSNKVHISLSDDELKVYELIGQEPEHIDNIALKQQAELGLLMEQILCLELKGIVKQLPGQFYVRI